MSAGPANGCSAVRTRALFGTHITLSAQTPLQAGVGAVQARFCRRLPLLQVSARTGTDNALALYAVPTQAALAAERPLAPTCGFGCAHAAHEARRGGGSGAVREDATRGPTGWARLGLYCTGFPGTHQHCAGPSRS